MGNEIDRLRAQGALAVIRQHPLMVLFALSPVLLALGVVWWLFGAGWALFLAIVAAVGGGVAVLIKRG